MATRGKPTEGRVKMVFFKLDNLSLELLEPVGGPSVWREGLKEKGECVHHTAFKVKGMDEHIGNIEKKGMRLTQRGRWTEGSGGCYAYFDSEEELGVILELLSITDFSGIGGASPTLHIFDGPSTSLRTGRQ